MARKENDLDFSAVTWAPNAVPNGDLTCVSICAEDFHIQKQMGLNFGLKNWPAPYYFYNTSQWSPQFAKPVDDLASHKIQWLLLDAIDPALSGSSPPLNSSLLSSGVAEAQRYTPNT